MRETVHQRPAQAKGTGAVVPLTAIKNDGTLDMSIHLNCHEFTWNCPSVQQPDFGTIEITYRPREAVVETKSLKFYLQQYRYYNAFAEELVQRICMDFAYWIQPLSVDVRLRQNSRGGISNDVQAEWSSHDENHVNALLKYKPKRGFQGGWATLPPPKDRE